LQFVSAKFRRYGGFAEYTLQAADTLISHPNVAAEIAAASPCAGWTALRALTDKLQVTVNDSILVMGGPAVSEILPCS